MGAYLFFGTRNSDDAVRYNAFLNKDSRHIVLKNGFDTGLYVYDQADIDWAEKKYKNKPADLKYWIDYFTGQLGRGEFKSSGQDYGEEVFELITQIFEEVNKHFNMKYLRRSCAWNPDCYFTEDQKKRITMDGKLLSGKE